MIPNFWGRFFGNEVSEHLEEEVEGGVADWDVLGVADDGVVGVADVTIAVDAGHETAIAVAHLTAGADGGQGGVVAVADGLGGDHGAPPQQDD